MWIAYAKYPEVLDLKTGVRYLRKLFEDIAFDADHEAVYGMGKIYSEEECKERAKKYYDGSELCDKFLKDGDLKSYVAGLCELKIQNYLSDIKDYIPLEDVVDVLDINSILQIYYRKCCKSSEDEFNECDC